MSKADHYERICGIVRNILRDSPAAHKRRVALRRGVRETSELVLGCDHGNWDHVKHWCDDCGVTRVELMEKDLCSIIDLHNATKP